MSPSQWAFMASLALNVVWVIVIIGLLDRAKVCGNAKT